MTEQYSIPRPGSGPTLRRGPGSTYRLQLCPEFPFAAAERTVPYLASLGVSHLHLSPALQARPDSAHGYDVVDHGRVREELGGERGLRALSLTARRHGLGLVLDIVPNHMAVPVPLRLNRPLWEVLRDGPGSRYARWFDIDWAADGGRVLLPVLAEPLDVRRLAVEDGQAGETLRYGEHEFPLREGTAGLPLPELLAAQWYRPAHWRQARTSLNYRRFFTISDLIGVRVEEPEVFAATHEKVLELVRDGVVEGLRIDHVDGLADPAEYLRRLRAAAGEDCWVVVEKILGRHEVLPADWPVAGTTGYDALYWLDGLFVDPAGADRLAARYREVTGSADWESTAEDCARSVLTVDLAAELALLTGRAGPGLADAVVELLVHFPVYRPYPGEGDTAAWAAAEAGAARAGADPGALAAVRALTASDPAFAARFAQTSAALRAKSLEDRAFYRYAPLLSATEVGGDPGRPAVTPAEFHAYAARLERDWPASGTVLSTHDTKRSADVRARIAALSERPDALRVPGGPADPQLAWVAAQSALGLGAVPDGPQRLADALLKAAKEAALRTSWTDPDPSYEDAVRAQAAAPGPVTIPPADPPAAPPAEPLTEAPAEAGPGSGAPGPVPGLAALAPAVRANTLGMAALQLAMPGVPEVYQGCEAEYRALVDPDNRRPARFHPAALAHLDGGGAPRGLSEEKLALTAALLRLRRDRPALFRGYAPLVARGPAADHCVAFLRGGALLVAVTRLALRLADGGGWRDTVLDLPPGDWRPLLPHAPAPPGPGPVPLGRLLGDHPVSVLLRQDADPAPGPDQAP
ncbi:malto-oligosyltrehalose synthase [Streptomyces sp. NPDC012888]|uniref:malto-oligosyltrehalose synthase n=1 Tax=Streptomyces sp. NPDC012888 TaxID=3364855 RepID=UPI0036A624E7